MFNSQNKASHIWGEGVIHQSLHRKELSQTKKLITQLSIEATVPLLVSAQDFEGWPAVGRDGIKVTVHFELAAINCTYSWGKMNNPVMI